MANNPLQALWNQLPAPFRNKYFLSLAIFFAMLVFFDKHDILTQWRLNRMVNKMEEDKAYYTKKIEDAKLERLDMDANKERFAREQYYMKKGNEDVYIIVEEEQ